MKSILDIDVQRFIEVSLNESIEKLALKKNQFPDIDYKEIINQIQAKNKAKTKLPTWFKTKFILYPSKISIEQTSSEITAKYKSNLVFGQTLIDLTSGFGVDSYYFSKKIDHVILCEINADLLKIVKHNFNQLQISNCDFYNGDGIEILQKLNQKMDWIYIDPSRRNDAKGKVFLLKDCIPNVTENIDYLFNFSDSILIKTAPILDVSAGISELKFIKKIHIVAVENEVKELLWELEKNYLESIEIKTVNINKQNSDNFDFIYQENTEITTSFPKKYIYEPNSAIMKSMGFGALISKFRIPKLHQNSHLFTSDDLIEFPGRIFKIEKEFVYSKKEMNFYLKEKKSNITIRNFPDTVENIRKKWKINDGGTIYSFFTTNLNNENIVLLCSKINRKSI